MLKPGDILPDNLKFAVLVEERGVILPQAGQFGLYRRIERGSFVLPRVHNSQKNCDHENNGRGEAIVPEELLAAAFLRVLDQSLAAHHDLAKKRQNED